MAKLEKPFTDSNVEDLKLPSGTHRIDYDAGNVRGFAVQTTYTGAKRFLLVYVAKASGRERRMVIGEFGKAPKLSVSAARKRAAQLRAMVDLGRDPWQEAKDQRAAAKAMQARSADTFGNLMLAYCGALERARKPSATGVRREIRTTLERGAVKLWKMPASEITLDDLAKPLHKLTRAQKYRQAEKTRSYIRAAYTMAAGSRGNANTSDLFEAFAALPNIGRDLPTIDRPKLDDDQDSGKRALSQPELAAYWKRIKSIDDPTGALLRFHLLTGAQRCAQLARLTDGSLSGRHHHHHGLQGPQEESPAARGARCSPRRSMPWTLCGRTNRRPVPVHARHRRDRRGVSCRPPEDDRGRQGNGPREGSRRSIHSRRDSHHRGDAAGRGRCVKGRAGAVAVARSGRRSGQALRPAPLPAREAHSAGKAARATR